MELLRCLALFMGTLAVARGLGPTNALNGAVCTREGEFAADTSNMCWYHQCVQNAARALQWIPRRCGWMTAVDENYVQALTNPCTVNLNSATAATGNPCERKSAPVADDEASCHPVTCLNGGTAVWEGDLCWCECAPSWRGNHDCSLPTGPTNTAPPGGDICVDGIAQQDWCAAAGYCLNGGTCHNQCSSFWCDCGEVSAMTADHIGKRCEIFTAPPPGRR